MRPFLSGADTKIVNTTAYQIGPNFRQRTIYTDHAGRIRPSDHDQG